MSLQSNWNRYAAYKAQSGLNVQASGSGASILRVTGGMAKASRANFGSNEARRDGMRTRGHLGSRKASANYPTELILGEADATLAAIMRGSFGAANLAITEATASLTSITTTTNTIVAGGGSWLTAGVRANEIWRLAGHSTAANNGKNLLVLGVTADTITLPAGSLTLNATPDTAFTLTRVGRKIINPPAGSLVVPYFTCEEYGYEMDQSEVFTDCVWSMFKYGMTKDGIITVERNWTGTGAYEIKPTGSSPFFTSPGETTVAPMRVVDAALYYNGVVIGDLTSFGLTIDLHPAEPPTVGVIAPDVPLGTMGVSIDIGVLQADLAKLADFDAETQISLNVLAVELESEPKDFHLINVPNFVLGDVAKSAISKEGGFATQTLSIPETLVGIDSAGGAYDSTMIKFQVSNAS